MKAIIEYENFFAFSESSNKYFNTPFSKGMNIVHGKNTSGKSTLLQAMLYTFGINDEKLKLSELLNERVIFRLDFILKKETNEKISILRDEDFLVIKRQDSPPIKFTGISGDSSVEHIKLKEYLGNMFGFDLYLESSGKYSPASIEAMFLPYYIAQDVGWVYKHKSFRGLDFVKNFKIDFFDYYLGISNDFDRDEKKRLEKEKSDLESENKFLSNIKDTKDELKLSKMKDEVFVVKSIEYIEPYKINKSELIELEKKYLDSCNKLAFLEQRKLILNRVKRALNKQKPVEGECPACKQNMPSDLVIIYSYLQDINDTTAQLEEIKKEIGKLKEVKGTINSLIKKISRKREVVAKEYDELTKYNVDNLTYNSWIENKVNVQLSEKLLIKLGENTLKLNEVIGQLSEFKTDEEVRKERVRYSYLFKGLFEKSLSDLGVKKFENNRFYLLYDIPAFPKQGVELLKTLLSYCFSFNKLIESTSYVHRFPFMLDAIFEGDLEEENKEKILEFIYKNKPNDTQIIFSIADSRQNYIPVETYNQNCLHGEAKLICLGENNKERAFLSPYEGQHEEYLKETLTVLGV